MNPGFLSIVLLIIALILLTSGWMDVLLRSMPHKGILLFFMLWFGLCRVTIALPTFKLNATFVLVAALASIIWLRTRGAGAKLHMLSVGLLLGSFHFLLRELFDKDPILIIARSDLDIAVLFGLITVVLQRSVALQLACLSLGMALGELYDAFLHRTPSAFLGSPSFQDEWWAAVFVSRLATLLLQGTIAGGKEVLHVWTDRRKGWRK
jgi:hypothetical protein